MFRINCFTSLYFLSSALLSGQIVTSFVVTCVMHLVRRIAQLCWCSFDWPCN